MEITHSGPTEEAQLGGDRFLGFTFAPDGAEHHRRNGDQIIQRMKPPRTPRPVPNQLSSRASLIAQQRMRLLQRIEAARLSGASLTTAARDCGISVVTAWRYQRALEAGGLPALAPRTDRSGRHSVADEAGLTPDLINLVRNLAVAIGSGTRAFKVFAELPSCPPKLARLIRRAKSVPPSLLALVKVHRRAMHVRECGGRLLIVAAGGDK